MSLELVERVAQWFESMGIEVLEYQEGDVRFQLTAEEARSLPAVTGEEPHACDVSSGESTERLVTAPAFGRLRLRHFISQEPVCSQGASIKAGDLVALLQIEDVLSGVVSKHAGIVGKWHVSDGDLVGFGNAILTVIDAA